MQIADDRLHAGQRGIAQQPGGEIDPAHQGAAVDPFRPGVPAFHAGRVQQFLALIGALKGQLVETGARPLVIPRQPRRPDDQLRRAFHPRIPGRLEKFGIKQRPQHRPDFAARLVIRRHQRVNGRRVVGRGDVPAWHLRLIGDKEIVQMARQESGGGRLLRHNVDDLLPVERAGFAQKGFLAVVVILGAVLKAPVEPPQRIAGDLGADGPAGKGAGRFLDILLGVVAHAHREQLQQFAAPVFVDRAAVVAVVVQPENHRRIARQFHQQVAETAHPAFAEHRDLLRKFRRVVHFGVAGGEKLVPKKRHLFLQRPLRVNHPVDPLGLVQRRPQSALVAGDEAVEQFDVHRFLPFGMEQFLDRGLVAAGGAGLQFGVGGAETGAAHQVAQQCDLFFIGHTKPSRRRIGVDQGRRATHRAGMFR